MTKDGLMQAIIRRIEDVTRHMQLPRQTPIDGYGLGSDEGGRFRAPRVHYNDLPGKTDDTEDFPYVIVRLYKASTAVTEATVDVKIIIGAYSTDNDGHRYPVLVGEVIERSFSEHSTLGGLYRLIGPIEWVNIETQAYPQFALVLNTRWHISAPVVRSEHT